MAKSDKNSDILFKFWEDPKNKDLIVNAVPLEILTFDELVRDHFDPKKVSTLPPDPSTTELKIWEILNSKPSDSDKPSMEAIKPFEAKSLKPAVPEPTKSEPKVDIPTSRSDIEPTSRSDIEPTPRSDIEPTPRSDIEPTPLSDIEPTPLSDIEPTSRSDIEPTPLSDIEPLEADLLEPAVPEPTNSESKIDKPTARSDIVPELSESEEVVIPNSWSEFENRYVYTPSDRFRIIEDQGQLHSFPFRCVGKLFWFNPLGTHPSDPRDMTIRDAIYWATAFYVGNNKILTAAHAFDLKKRKCIRYPQYPEREAIFVPAMSTKYDYLGKNFGSYLVSNLKKIVGYMMDTPNINNRQYDICSVDIHSGKKQGRDVEIDHELEEGIILHPYFPFSYYSSSVIGYASCPQNKNLKMCIMNPVPTCAKQDNCVRLSEGIPTGISGGPWMNMLALNLLLESNQQSNFIWVEKKNILIHH